MGQIAGHDYQVGAIFEPVDGSDRAFESFGAQRVRWPVESDMRVAQLDERERCGGFTVEIGESAHDPLGARRYA